MIKIEINIDKLSTLSDEDKRGLRLTANYLLNLSLNAGEPLSDAQIDRSKTITNKINDESIEPICTNSDIPIIPETVPQPVPVSEPSQPINWEAPAKKTRTRKPKAEWVAPVLTSIPPPPPPEPEDTTDIYAELVELITENVSNKKLSPKKMLEILKEFGCESLPMVNQNRHLVPQITNRFKEFLDHGA